MSSLKIVSTQILKKQIFPQNPFGICPISHRSYFKPLPTKPCGPPRGPSPRGPGMPITSITAVPAALCGGVSHPMAWHVLQRRTIHSSVKSPIGQQNPRKGFLQRCHKKQSRYLQFTSKDSGEMLTPWQVSFQPVEAKKCSLSLKTSLQRPGKASQESPTCRTRCVHTGSPFRCLSKKKKDAGRVMH